MTLPNWAIRAVAEYRAARSLALLFELLSTLAEKLRGKAAVV